MKSMTGIIIRRTEEAGHRPLPDNIIAVRAIGYVKHLNGLGVRADEYDAVYELASSIYNDTPNEGPFGIDHLIKAAKRLKAAKREVVMYERPDKMQMVSCTTCQGSKIAFMYADGKVIGMQKDSEGKIKHCEDCQ